MRNWIWIVAVAGFIAVLSVHGAEEPTKPSGVFSTLKVGQTVTLKDEGAAFSISYFDTEAPLAHKVVEIGDNFIIVQDMVGVTETTIPIYSVKAVVKVRVKGT